MVFKKYRASREGEKEVVEGSGKGRATQTKGLSFICRAALDLEAGGRQAPVRQSQISDGMAVKCKIGTSSARLSGLLCTVLCGPTRQIGIRSGAPGGKGCRQECGNLPDIGGASQSTEIGKERKSYLQKGHCVPREVGWGMVVIKSGRDMAVGGGTWAS